VFNDRDEEARLADVGLTPMVDVGNPEGVDTATATLGERGVGHKAITVWARRQKDRANGPSGEPRVAA
jgi:hypothetical protein